jgi:hypothetical protein
LIGIDIGQPGERTEVIREVGVHDFRMATKQQLLHLYGGLLGVSPSAVGVDFRRQVGFSR